MRLPRAPPQQQKSQRRKDVGAGVEHPVERHVEFKVRQGVGRAPIAGHHMVPLWDLMERDAVEERAQGHSQKNFHRNRKSSRLGYPPSSAILRSHPRSSHAYRS